MFGYGYSPVENLVLEAGKEYQAKIIGFENNRYQQTGNEYILVKLEIVGMAGYNPNTITLDDRPKAGEMKRNGSRVDENDLKRWDGRMTRFFDCFDIQRGDFFAQDWINHTGTVLCNWQYDPNEPDHKSKKYKELFPVVKEKSPAQDFMSGGNPIPATQLGFSAETAKAIQQHKEIVF